MGNGRIKRKYYRWEKQTNATVIQYQGKNIRIETDKQKSSCKWL